LLRAKRHFRYLSAFLILALSLAVPALMASGADVSRPSFETARVSLDRGDGTIVTFDVEIAQTPRQWSFGLMHVPSMPAGQGMLFIFPDMAPRSFWMKNTLIPLDMLFFDDAGALVSAVRNVPPRSLGSRRSKGNARFVLELNGGTMDARGITAAARLHLRKNDGW